MEGSLLMAEKTSWTSLAQAFLAPFGTWWKVNVGLEKIEAHEGREGGGCEGKALGRGESGEVEGGEASADVGWPCMGSDVCDGGAGWLAGGRIADGCDACDCGACWLAEGAVWLAECSAA